MTKTESDIIPAAKKKLGVYKLLVPLILPRQWFSQGGGAQVLLELLLVLFIFIYPYKKLKQNFRIWSYHSL